MLRWITENLYFLFEYKQLHIVLTKLVELVSTAQHTNCTNQD